MNWTSRLAAGAAAGVLTISGILIAPVTESAAEPLAPGVTTEQNPRVPEGAAWSEAYFPSSAPSSNGDPVELHADILRPVGLAADDPSPVIMSAGAYFSHRLDEYMDETEHTGPSPKFKALMEAESLMARGYTLVTVDLRGYGGSTGCFDLLGPGEQADVESAVNWIADQEWSNGAVGMYGFSYDAGTALIGANRQPEGLKAVVAQEPLWDYHNNFYTNGVARNRAVEDPEFYAALTRLGGFTEGTGDIPPDTPRYLANAAYEEDNPECETTTIANVLENKSEDSAYWRERDLAEQAKGSRVPILFTQGFLDQNTRPEDMERYLANHEGPQRAWLGPWRHTTGDATDSDEAGNEIYEMGRSDWFEQVMSFYDEYLLGIPPSTDYPDFLIQDSLGRWRSQDNWPEVTRRVSVDLGAGQYLDNGWGDNPDQPGYDDLDPQRPPVTDPPRSFSVVSYPVESELRITSTPVLRLSADKPGNAIVRLWEVAPDGTAVLFLEEPAALAAGDNAIEMPSTDWTLGEGRSLAVSVGTVVESWWPVPTDNEIKVTAATLDLSLQSTAGDIRADGSKSSVLDRWIDYYARELGSPAPRPSFTLSLAEPEPPPSPTPTSPGEPRPTEPAEPTPSQPTPTKPGAEPTEPGGATPAPARPPLADTGGASAGALVAGLILVAAGLAASRRSSRQRGR